jgi:hypothetical protein
MMVSDKFVMKAVEEADLHEFGVTYRYSYESIELKRKTSQTGTAFRTLIWTHYLLNINQEW